ncbi:MAG: hypothetical protein AB1724_13750 [Thermodesulfobacteriota bacterium]
MTHQDAGKYSAKHPAGTKYDPAIETAIRERAENGKVTCAAAHGIADHFRVPPSEVGKTIDLMEYRIVRCQLGLFGYSPEKKVVTAAREAPAALHQRLQQSVVDGKVSCLTCWDIARDLGVNKMDVSSACELLKIKISPCQLGAF